MKIRRNILWLVMALLSLTSCMDAEPDINNPDDLEIDWPINNSIFGSYIRFETEAGGNPLSVLSDIIQPKEYDFFEPENLSWLDLECIRGTDGARMTLGTTAWFTPHYPDQVAMVGGEGPVLMVTWVDMDLVVGQNTEREYDESYTLKIRSSRLLGNDEARQIKWSVHVKDGDWTLYKLEVDGKEVSRYQVNDDNRFFGLVRLIVSYRGVGS